MIVVSQVGVVCGSLCTWCIYVCVRAGGAFYQPPRCAGAVVGALPPRPPLVVDPLDRAPLPRCMALFGCFPHFSHVGFCLDTTESDQVFRAKQ